MQEVEGKRPQWGQHSTVWAPAPTTGLAPALHWPGQLSRLAGGMGGSASFHSWSLGCCSRASCPQLPESDSLRRAWDSPLVLPSAQALTVGLPQLRLLLRPP